MRIITVSREFGSGGREIGKRLADSMGIAYYDKEIISEIAEEMKIKDIIEKETMSEFPISFGRTFASLAFFGNSAVNMVVSEQRIIRQIAKRGEDFVIVGRSADVTLKKYKPCNIFVYADIATKKKRCKKRFEKNDKLTERDLERKIRQVDNARKKHRDLLSTEKWGDKKNYHLCINTTGFEIKDLVPTASAFIESYFNKKK